MTAWSKQSSPAVKAGVYTRISWDPSGQRAGVERQRADCEEHCLARGWDVVEVFCDNDASAYGRKPRRAYERMLAAVESGSIDAIVTWHNDRLHPSPKELEAFIDLVERSRVDGRLSARIVGAVARKSPRTAAAGCAASTSSSPSKASPPASWVGACAATTSGSWSERPPAEC